MDAGTAPLPSSVRDGWKLQVSWGCPRGCGKGVYKNGRSRICVAGVHQWNAMPKE